MTREFDPGYRGRYRQLVQSYPAESVYPSDSFRVEWGPIFHRGRTDGSARVLVIGQDPAAHETIARRILVGEAGQRAQGLLARLGHHAAATSSSTRSCTRCTGRVAGRGTSPTRRSRAYRNRWIDTIVKGQQIEAIIALGQLADKAYQAWRTTPLGASSQAAYVTVRHPTYPESASASGTITKAEAFERLCQSWNEAPGRPAGARHAGHPGRRCATTARRSRPTTSRRSPTVDLPAGLPAWMGDLDAWAAAHGRRRAGEAGDDRRDGADPVPHLARALGGWPVSQLVIAGQVATMVDDAPGATAPRPGLDP